MVYFAGTILFCFFAATLNKGYSMIVGRKGEIAELEKLYHSDRPEFVAIYGRRRVGKTFLIKQALTGRLLDEQTF